MAGSGSSIDGLASGLDTTTIISQLMQLERQPVAILNQRKTKEAAKVSAYQDLNTKLAALQAAANDLASNERWTGAKATSSSTSVAAVATSSAIAGSYSFDVTQTAKAQSYVTSGSVASTAASITASSSITITKGVATPVTVQVGDGSMASVISGINSANAGVRASALQTGATSFRLVLTSTTTGDASDFTVTDGGNATPLGALDEQVAGQDALIGIGDPLAPGHVVVSSASNTVADVVPGVTLTVSAPAAGVTVDVKADVVAIGDQVAVVVGTANAILGQIKNLTAYDATKKTAGLLMGDSAVREIERRIRDQVSAAVGSTSPATAGVQLSRDGSISFDRAKFETAFAADPAATARLFQPGGSVSHPDGAYAALAGRVRFVSADDRTVSGSYPVTVTQAARQTMIRLSGPVAGAEDITLTIPGATTPTHVLAAPGDGVTELAAKVNAASAGNNLGLMASVVGGALEIRAVSYGSSPTFTASTSGTMTVDPTVAGLDAAGSINGVAATGIGQVLSAPAADPTLWGLSVLVSATAADVTTASGQAGANANLFGNLTYLPGVGQRVDSTAGDAIRAGTGRLTTLISGGQARLDGIDDEIASYEQRLTIREDTLRRQFANLESALGKLKSQGNWLTGQLSALSQGNG